MVIPEFDCNGFITTVIDQFMRILLFRVLFYYHFNNYTRLFTSLFLPISFFRDAINSNCPIFPNYHLNSTHSVYFQLTHHSSAILHYLISLIYYFILNQQAMIWNLNSFIEEELFHFTLPNLKVYFKVVQFPHLNSTKYFLLILAQPGYFIMFFINCFRFGDFESDSIVRFELVDFQQCYLNPGGQAAKLYCEFVYCACWKVRFPFFHRNLNRQNTKPDYYLLHLTFVPVIKINRFLMRSILQNYLKLTNLIILIILTIFYSYQISQTMDKEHRLSDIFIKKDLFVKSRKQNIKDYFDFIKALGKGAYGTVYKAKTKQFPNNERAVKVITKKNVKNQKALIDQVNILKQLDHPSIVKIYETFEDQKYLCLVLDYCQGGQLFERLQKFGSFSEMDARNIFTQMTKIIKYLHSNKICHRDLKPQNFLMDRNDSLQIKLTDFGLSCKWSLDLRQQLKQNNANKIVGTSYYIAPQILKKDYNQNCDVWSLGVLLYILVTACPPFEGKDDHQILNNVKKQEYSLNIPEMNKVSAELKDLIKKILVSEDKRVSIDEILNHPWMTGKIPQEPLKLNFAKMKQFANFSRLKTVVVTYIASQLPEKQIHQLGKAFKQVDKNSDGLLTIQELKEVLEQQKQIVTFLQLKQLIQFIDTDKNGKINYNEFIAACLETSYINNQKYLRQVFNYFDVNKDGKISSQQFKQILQQSGITQINQNAIEEIIKAADSNKDGQIDYNEFLANMIDPTS